MRLAIRAAVAAFTTTLAAAQVGEAAEPAFPNKPVRLLVTYAPGGASDIVSRLIASKLTQGLRQQVIVENRPGASGIIASELLVRAPADGYTIIHVNIAHGANPYLNAKLPYDTTKDFSSVTLLALLPMILLTHPSLPGKSVGDLIALIKAKRGGLNYASAGSGSANHLAMELFMHATGLDATHVPYKGGGPAIADLLGGQIPMMFITIPPALPHAKAGKVRVLAVSSAKRSPVLPNVPTVAESGVPGFDFNEWQAILAPRGTPRNVIARLNGEINKALAQPDVKERMSTLGAATVGGTPEQLTTHVAAELKRWSTVIKKSGIGVQK
ncbi:MAG: tripartite tricarboxylate transporter substrate binding protein [Betaproteobacteria bacterium]|nr:tripartite tricarboxylate transporter substrate binding protein [Betaproteobacteria bacterium]